MTDRDRAGSAGSRADEMMDVETFRAKVLVILSEAVDHPLSIGHAARRITELYAETVPPPITDEMVERAAVGLHSIHCNCGSPLREERARAIAALTAALDVTA